MWFNDGVLDVVGNYRRSATPNALFKSRFSGAPIDRDLTPTLFRPRRFFFSNRAFS
jgi:hypothetical protein